MSAFAQKPNIHASEYRRLLGLQSCDEQFEDSRASMIACPRQIIFSNQWLAFDDRLYSQESGGYRRFFGPDGLYAQQINRNLLI